MAQSLEQGRREVGTTLPAPLKPEHGWRENRGEKRQQLGAEPASSRSERLEKDRVCIVPWGSRCPAVPDTLLARLPSPRTAFSNRGRDFYPRHSPNAVPAPRTALAVPGLTPASMKPKGSREKVGTEAG